jgi:hypothetical protein
MAFTPHKVDEIPNVMIHTHGVSSPSALGLAGGHPGVTNYLLIKRNSNLAAVFRRGIVPGELTELEGETVERPPPFIYTQLKNGDVFECGGGGGGGYGDPIARAPELVLQDVQNGNISSNEAKTRYGVLMNAAGSAVDSVATPAERDRIRNARQDASRAALLTESEDSFAVGIDRKIRVRCRCDEGLPAVPASETASLPARDIRFDAEVFASAQGVHKSDYVIRESFCPVCWSLAHTQVLVPHVEP